MCIRDRYTDILSSSTEIIAKQSMIGATKEAVEENETAKTDISIAFEGSWQKRGFKSKNVYGTITSLDTGNFWTQK